jgi:uncharacterized protein YkwD
LSANSILRVESLELRDCPATANLFNGVLTVQGTSGADVIQVTQSGTQIVAAGQGFAASSIVRVVISGGAGADTLIDNSGRAAVIYGGDGNDIIRAAAGNDRLYGGRGADQLYGGTGNDTIYGGGGIDTIVGGTGTNTIVQGSPTATRGNTAIELRIIQLVNSYRATNGLPQLAVNGLLNVAADLHSGDMAAIGSRYGPNVGMQHTLYGTLRPEVTDRLAWAGYDNWTYSYAWGENIAYGYTSAAAVMTAWMNSPGHRANILNSSFTEIGVSVRVGTDGILYFTQNFGSRS